MAQSLKFGRQAHLRLGRIGEAVARRFFREADFTVMATNYRTQVGEIDLIVLKAHCIHFVEVKTRRRRYLKQPLAPLEMVHRKKRERIIRTAKVAIHQAGLDDYDYSYDVFEVIVSGEFRVEAVHFHEAAFKA